MTVLVEMSGSAASLQVDRKGQYLSDKRRV